MIKIEVLVEEPSMEPVLDHLMPSILAGRATYKIINFQSKERMLRLLPQRLEGYRQRLRREELRILVLIDEDRGDCLDLKKQLKEMALACGLKTKTNPGTNGSFQVVNRIVIEELEAWFFGDPVALRTVFPKLPENLHKKAAYRNPDRISGGTWERLHEELRYVDYYRGTYPKIQVARAIAPHLVPDRNASKSFQPFVSGVKALLNY